MKTANIGNPRPTMALLVALHDAAMALNSIPGLDGTACQNVINAFWAASAVVAPLGWLVRRGGAYEHVTSLVNLNIWGEFAGWLEDGMRPATAVDMLCVALVAVGEQAAEVA